MNGDEHSRQALDRWFDRQRRKWWRGLWPFGLVFLGGLVLFWVLGQLAYQVYLSQRYSHAPSGYMAQFPATWGQSVVILLALILIPLTAIVLVAQLGRHYRIPDELLTASTALDCQRAFQRVFRWDAYFVYGLVCFAPALVFGVMDLPDWQQYLLGLLSAASLTALLVELIVWLHSWRRCLHLAVYLALPLGYLVVLFGMQMRVSELWEALTGFVDVMPGLPTSREPELIVTSTVAILLAFLVASQSRRLPAGRDPWRP
ncbi:hypothetical protein JW859_04480 [bacterium]|nr:hypothetical protein [bacterium]